MISNVMELYRYVIIQTVHVFGLNYATGRSCVHGRRHTATCSPRCKKKCAAPLWEAIGFCTTQDGPLWGWWCFSRMSCGAISLGHGQGWRHDRFETNKRVYPGRWGTMIFGIPLLSKTVILFQLETLLVQHLQLLLGRECISCALCSLVG